MENIRDWNISRQLWWGHQIPVYYYGENKSDFVVAESKDLALIQAIKKTGNSNLTLDSLVQEKMFLTHGFHLGFGQFLFWMELEIRKTLILNIIILLMI